MKPLFIKPHPDMKSTEILFQLHSKEFNRPIAFRSLDLSADLPLIHEWVNQTYAKRFWQMDRDEVYLHNHYNELLNNALAHSFIGLFNEKIVCQIDCYQVSDDELKEHVPAAPGNCGFHILMLPPKESFKSLTESMLRAFVKFFFSFGAAQTLYGEPDAKNTPANMAAKRSGFEFQKTIELSYKTANLYAITRQQFFANEK